MEMKKVNLGYQPPPRPTLNGGLYTGTPFLPGAPWANVPEVPDAGYLTVVTLSTAHPPRCGQYQMLAGGGLRPGNNTPLLPLSWADSVGPPGLGLLCASDAACTPMKTDVIAIAPPWDAGDAVGRAYSYVR